MSDTREILEKVKNGEIGVAQAEKLLERGGIEEMGYAKLDMNRDARTGFPEVIYCERKTDDFLISIYRKMLKQYGEVFGTRASDHQYRMIRDVIPEVVYDPVSRILKVEKRDKVRIGRIAVCTAGTADISVRRKRRRRLNFSGLQWTGSMMWASVGYTGCSRIWRKFRRQTVSSRLREWRGLWRVFSEVSSGIR